MSFIITGHVRELESGRGVPNLRIEAWDKDLLFDDKLGEGLTDSIGQFRIAYTEEEFRDVFEKRPDIYLKVLAPNGTHLHSTEKHVRCESGKEEHFDIDLPKEKLMPNMENENTPQKLPTEEQPETAAAQKPPMRLFERERQRFRALILANPNYFGNIKVSPFKPVLNIQSNTTYEEIGCVGFQP